MNTNGRSAASHITAHGRTQTIRAWARETGLRAQCIRKRLLRGATAEEAVDASRSPQGRGPVMIEWEGERITAAELAKRTGVPAYNLRRRWRKGLRGRDLVRRERMPAQPVVWRGERKTLAQWAAPLGISGAGLRHRITAGWELCVALTMPSKRLQKEQQ